MKLDDIEPIFDSTKGSKALEDKECFTEFIKVGKDLDVDKLLE